MSTSLLLSGVVFFWVTYACSVSSSAFMASFKSASLTSSSLDLVIYCDMTSCLFTATVLTISGAVMAFSRSYLSGESSLNKFYLLLTTFILSMLLLIFSPNLFSMFLGWDGLGVSSYLLILFYQKDSGLTSGMATLLTNRVGDVLLLLVVGGLLSNSSWMLMHWSLGKQESLVIYGLILLAAASTKSAQIPFSAWLPLAMAAPTPVSALVHSSTLVTAGVYVVIRLGLNAQPLMVTMLFFGSLTTLMAGVSGLLENDLKKVVALSTLSQLGVMFSSLGAGQPTLALFHLVTHAFFKAMIFIAAGQVLHLSSGDQDLRKAHSRASNSPWVISYFCLASLSLGALPFLSGCVSKHSILEACSGLAALGEFSSWSVMLGGMLTWAYSIRLQLILVLKLKANSWEESSDNDSSAFFAMSVLWPFSMMAGSALSGALMAPETASPSSFWMESGAALWIGLGSALGASVALLSTEGLAPKSHTWSSLAALSLTSYPVAVLTKAQLNQALLGASEQLWNEFLITSLAQGALWGKQSKGVPFSTGDVLILTLLTGALGGAA